jgi:hypothetical protein
MTTKYQTEAIEPIGPTRKTKKLDEDIQAAPYVPVPPIKLQPAPLLPNIDILQPAPPVAAAIPLLERPKLPAPEAPSSRTLSEFRYLKVMDDMKTRSNRITESMLERFNIYKRQVQSLNDQQIEKIKENAEKASKSNTWSMLSKLAAALLASLSLALGLTIIGGGGSTFTGGAMIASGVFSLANFVCTEANIWDALAKKLAHDDEEKRKKIGVILPIAVGVLCAGLGLYAGTQNLTHVQNLGGQLASVLQLGLTAFKGVTMTGHAVSSGYVTRSEADLMVIRDMLNEERIFIQSVSAWIENFRAETKGLSRMANNTTTKLIQANLKMAQAN